MTEVATFEDHVLRVVDRFLQTVVVVDDRAFGEGAVATGRVSDEPPATIGRGVQSGLVRPKVTDEHALDAKKVTDAFARDGLVCGLLQPAPGAAIDTELLRTARRADLVVIDWVLERDNGQKALDLVRKILNDEANESHRRLRTIAIYTGQSDLKTIARKLQAIVEKAYPDEALHVTDGGLTLMKGPLRAAVFAKENATGLPASLEGRRVKFDKLPERLRREFAALTSGLVTLVALAALAALRDDTHRVLSVLSSRLDPAYLGHRSVLPTPSDAQEHAIDLVSRELRSVLDDHDIGSEVSQEALLLWLAVDRPKFVLGQLVDLPASSKGIALAHAKAMLSHGLGSSESLDLVVDAADGPSKRQWEKIKKTPTRVFADTDKHARDADAELAERFVVRTQYTLPQRVLELGTVVRNSRGHYLVCVQPICDSVRLGGKERAYPFLRASKATRDGKANLVVPGASTTKHQRLLVDKNPHDLVIARFRPGRGQQSSTVRPRLVGEVYMFKDTTGQEFEWVCQLKADHAQKLVGELAQQFARVGVDGSEVLRLGAK